MAMEEALVARLAGAAPIAAFVVDGSRVSWFERPNPSPALRLTKVSPGQEWTMAGPDGLDGPRVQITAFANDPDVVAALARAVRTEMQRTVPVTVAGTLFHPASLELERWPEPDDLDGGERIYCVVQDFEFYHQPQEG